MHPTLFSKKRLISGILCFFLIASCQGNNSTPQQPDEQSTEANGSLIGQLPQTKVLSERIEKEPNNPELYFARGSMLLSMNDANAASKDFVKAITLDSTKAQYYLAAAEVFYNVQRVPQAVLVLERAERNAPPDPRIQLELGKAYYTIQKYDKAAEKLNPLLTQQPDNAIVCFWMGMLQKDQNKTQEAIKYLKKATDLDPKYYNAHIMLAQIYAQAGNTTALNYYNKAVAIDSTKTEALYGKAMFLQQNNNTKQAIAAYQKLIEQDPQNQDAFYNLGYIYYNQNDYKKAKEHFELATKMNPVFAKAYYMRGQCSEKLGEKDNAKADYNKAITFDPELKIAEEALKNLK